jgi:hypothetical protein
MTDEAISPLRRRMIEDMTIRNFAPKSQHEHVQRVKNFADNWVKKVLSQFGESTAINYRSRIRKHLVPFFGDYTEKEITPELVQAFIS